MKKRIISMLLLVVMLLGMLPTAAFAADSVEEALGEIDIYNGGVRMSYLSINGINRELIYTYYNYIDRNGQTREIPAYCVNPNIKGVPQTVSEGESIKYLAEERGSDPKVVGIVANGYPTRSLSELGVENKYHAYYATKAALWCYLLPNWDINNLKVNPSLTGVELQRAQQILAAAKDIYRRGTSWTKVLTPGIVTEVDQDVAYPVTVDGENYYQQIFTVTSETWVCDYIINVAFSDPSAVPPGTKIVDMNNREITQVKTEGTGNGYSGKFKVLYPADSIDGETGSVQLSIKTNVYKYGVYYAVCAEKDQYGNLQNYMVDTDPTIPLNMTAYSSYTSDPDDDPAETSLKIIKLEEGTEIPLRGAIFEVVDPKGATVGTFATNSRGEIVIPLSLAGNYTVYERTAPSGYLLSEEPAKNVQVVYGEQATLTFENAPYGSLEVRKYSIKDPATQDCYIKAGTQKTLTFENTPLSAIVIKKVDADTGAPLEGAWFRIRFLGGTSGTGGTVIAERQTSSNGTIVLTGMKAGTYVIEEISAPDGYVINDSAQTVYLSGKEQDVITVVFGNDKMGSLLITKKDAVTGAPISDVEFLVTNSDGGVIGNANGKFVTDSAGTIRIDGLEPGSTVIVKETRAKDGYLLDDTPQTIKIKANETMTLEFRNQPLGGLIIHKLDSVTKEPLEGAQFKITFADGSFVDDEGGKLSSNGLYTTDKNGQIIIRDVTGTLVVTEVKAPDGYLIDENTRSQTVVVRPDDTQTLTFYNTPSGGLQIIKSDEDTGARIKGVKFEIRKMNGEIIGTYTTDRNGVISLPEAESGWYQVTELKAADGYQLDDTPAYVCVKDGETATLEITNQRMSSIMIHKIDSETREGIYGVKFILYDAGKNPVGEYTTDQDGYIWIDDELTPGKYYLRELEAADGYILDEQYKTVYVERGKCAQITWENTAVTGQIQVRKYAEAANTITGDQAGAPLKGAVYEITQARSGKVVGYITTDAHGVAASDPLPLGRYFVTEVSAPAYYQINSEKMEAEIEYPGQIIKLSQYDKPAKLGVTIKKSGNLEVQPGTTMRYDLSGIANTSNVALNNFYWHDRLPTDATNAMSLTTGTYNQRLYYRITFKTNVNDYRVLASNLLTSNNYSVKLSAAALGLVQGEYVTDIRFEFGTVASGFSSVTKPTIQVQVKGTLPDGYQIINRSDVGGQYLNEWQTATSNWVTIVRRFQPVTPLPKTGY